MASTARRLERIADQFQGVYPMHRDLKPSPYQIAAFTQAARDRSFSKAAKNTGVTQSSITQHVAKLERAMGVQLFQRKREGLELTRAGRELFEISDRLRSLEQQVEEKLQDYGGLATGHLRIIANAPRPVMPVIARYGAQYPKVEIEFSLCSRTEALRLLNEREVDIAVIVTEPEEDGLSVEKIGTTRYKAFVRRDHPLAGRGTVSLRELAGETIILPEEGSLTKSLVMERASLHGIELTSTVRTHSFPMVKEAVLHGIGVGFLLEEAQYPSANLTSLEVAEIPDIFSVCLITPAEKRNLRLISSFCDTLLDAI